MLEDNTTGFLGRKVFFLHPSALIQNQVIEELVQEEYEIYAVKDESKLRRLLKRYPDSIVFANISDGMKESAWEEWIRSVLTSSETAGTDIGIIAYADNENFRYKYLDQMRVRCGFTVMKADLSTVITQLKKILSSANAKGRRKFIRAIISNGANISVNLPMNGTFVNGIIRDISTMGFSCYFADDPGLTKNHHYTDIQIRLKSQLLKVQGMVFGSRMQQYEKVYVILFTPRTSPDVLAKVRTFIHSYLQSKMDMELKD